MQFEKLETSRLQRAGVLRYISCRTSNMVNDMSTTDEIESAVSALPPLELNRFRAWFEQFDADAWDRQIEEDVKAGRFNKIADRAVEDFRAGRCTEL
jgi:hypothetical protein